MNTELRMFYPKKYKFTRMKKVIYQISILLFCILVSCKEYKPTYGICVNVSQYPIIQQAGYTYIEPTVGEFLVPDKSDSVFLIKLAEQKRLNAKIISSTSFIPRHLKMTGPETKHDDIMVWAETTFSRMQKAGIPYIVLGSGGARNLPENFSKQEATQQFISLCKRLGPLAQKYSVTVVIEPLHTGVCNFINSLKEGAEIVKAVKHPNIQLLCDIRHMMKDDEPASEIIKYGKYIKHCHIAEKETYSAPGTKGDDFTEYFKALKKLKYTGCISVEATFDHFESRIYSALQYMQQQYH